MNFNNQLFNPLYVNQMNYSLVQHRLELYELEQDQEITNAVKAIHDYCEAMKKLDPKHQDIANQFCLLEIAKQINLK